MNNRLLASLILGALPLTMVAQDDDMYFVPTKKAVEREAASYDEPRATYYSGINRSVDEYNRRGGSYYQVLPADTSGTGNDVISFNGEQGVYPADSVNADNDYALTRRMARYDGYEPDIAFREGYREGYRDGRHDSWHSPWYYSTYYPWYDSYWYWNDPWYYSYYGWYDPWYYDPWYRRPYGWYGYHYGYYRPYYYGTVYVYGGGGVGSSKYRQYNNMVARSPRGFSNGRQTVHSAGPFGGSSIRRGSFTSRTGSVGVRTATSSSNNYGNFGGTRSWGSSSSGSSSSGSFGGGSFGGGSFGGATRSSGGSFGGGGGGGFGGSHSVGGSRSSRR